MKRKYMFIEKHIQEILAEYRLRLKEVLGESLESIMLYGSQARGDAEGESDIDVLCVMKNSFNYGELIDKTSQATAEISMKHGVTLSRAFVTSADFKTRKTPFLMNVRREGLAV